MSIPYRRILLPLDGSEIAKQALPYAQEQAAQSGAELMLLQVVPPQEDTPKFTQNLQISQPGLERQQYLVDHASRWLQQVADNLALHKIRAKVMLDIGDPAEKILDCAAQQGVDLIVISTHGRSGVARWAYGSVAGKVIGAAPCPVLLVRAQLPK
jgi:nucleotide-binding universal stress UspA family protein